MWCGYLIKKFSIIPFSICCFKILVYKLQVLEVLVEVVEGDARNVLCDAVDRHRASVLVLGSHGYGAIKRYLLINYTLISHIIIIVRSKLFI